MKRFSIRSVAHVFFIATFFSANLYAGWFGDHNWGGAPKRAVPNRNDSGFFGEPRFVDFNEFSSILSFVFTPFGVPSCTSFTDSCVKYVPKLDANKALRLVLISSSSLLVIIIVHSDIGQS